MWQDNRAKSGCMWRGDVRWGAHLVTLAPNEFSMNQPGHWTLKAGNYTPLSGLLGTWCMTLFHLSVFSLGSEAIGLRDRYCGWTTLNAHIFWAILADRRALPPMTGSITISLCSAAAIRCDRLNPPEESWHYEPTALPFSSSLRPFSCSYFRVL